MKYFKNSLGDVFTYSDIQTPKDGLVLMTKKETEAHLNPKPTPEQVLADQITEAQTYLNRTDHKFYLGYVPKVDEDLDAILLVRNEKRAFIRANE